MLFPTSAYNISNSEIEYTMDLESFADIDWQQALLDDLQEDAIQWKSAKQKSANPSTRSCAPFLLVYYLDNLDHPFNNSDRNIVPWAVLFTRKQIEKITIDDCNGTANWGVLKVQISMHFIFAGTIFPGHGSASRSGQAAASLPCCPGSPSPASSPAAPPRCPGNPPWILLLYHMHV
ncbi:hypothetical protein BS78_05G125700 [Paspalum vaginatum]|uniref:Uncharacterized protein n=1 Tax=Paspalum vaginatum TaxID=158149 RepID=A0A9W8CGF5_9POAL|nr:hypothetical protein BS78_K329700 [Paspalum vaginatum]KAJ1275304.1 hypothetical protein BS78_05G125700 [Paspalum vaginatum]